MAEIQFYKLIFNHNELKDFLEMHNLILSERAIQERGLLCRNPNCSDPSRGFFSRLRKRKLAQNKVSELQNQGQDINYLNSFQCKACKTFLSPRTNGFLTYCDSLRRSNCKLAQEKVLQMIFHWVSQRSGRESSQDIGLDKNTIMDWYNFCRVVTQKRNIIAHQNLLGNGVGRLSLNETPQGDVYITEEEF
ncbi:hypothetical protein RF11_07137 [Thelohanellus kitauei]|uniref:Uncharacterized protein n=1 Tax=Thelohanellus kitauei TaxID=669202 RepID=A0A0C2MB55_THEKT|nr:hypothetical protein RF11_07137 [Thelohanellus kitauei]